MATTTPEKSPQALAETRRWAAPGSKSAVRNGAGRSRVGAAVFSMPDEPKPASQATNATPTPGATKADATSNGVETTWTPRAQRTGIR